LPEPTPEELPEFAPGEAEQPRWRVLGGTISERSSAISSPTRRWLKPVRLREALTWATPPR
jgi:hypothetical protein